MRAEREEDGGGSEGGKLEDDGGSLTLGGSGTGAVDAGGSTAVRPGTLRAGSERVTDGGAAGGVSAGGASEPLRTVAIAAWIGPSGASR